MPKDDQPQDTHVLHEPDGTSVTEGERVSNDEPREAYYQRIAAVRVAGE